MIPVPIPKLRRLRLLPLLLIVLTGPVSCSRPGDGAGRPDVLLLTVDTLRGDRWGCLGDARARTPYADRMARGAILALEGRAPVPVTLPSHTSMMTGLPPAAHGVRDNGIFRLPEGEGTTLAEAMRRGGYTTAAFVGAYPLAPAFGLDRGFDRYDSYFGGGRDEDLGAMRQRTAGETVARIERWLAGGRGTPPSTDTPLFLWVHFFDPHAEYEPPAPWTDVLEGDAYRAEVAYADHQTGRLLRLLGRYRGARPLRIVAAADHGEGLHEHSESTHGALIHTSTIHVPLLVRRPGYAPRLLAGPRSVERVAATVLAEAGLDPRLNRDGAPPLEEPVTPVHAETLYPWFNFGWSGLRSREEDGWRLISGPVDRLYRIAEDPGEEHDVAAQHPDVVARLRRGIEEEWTRRRGEAFRPESRSLSEEDAEALRALGYVAGGGAEGAAEEDMFGRGADPQTRLPFVDLVNRGLTLLGDGDTEEAVALLRQVVVQDPANRFAWQYLARAEHEAGRLEEAREAYRTALRLGPNPDPVYRDLALVERELGNRDAEREVLLEALAVNPRSVDVRNRLAAMLLSEGKADEARTLLLEAVEIRPRDARSWANLARISEREGRREEARGYWERVAELEDEGPLAALARLRLSGAPPGPEEEDAP